jgi:hypothetical protein
MYFLKALQVCLTLIEKIEKESRNWVSEVITKPLILPVYLLKINSIQ